MVFMSLASILEMDDSDELVENQPHEFLSRRRLGISLGVHFKDGGAILLHRG